MTTIVSGDSGGTAITTVTVVNQNTTGMTIKRLTSGSGTYTTPANVKSIRVRMIAGGGGAYGTNGSGTTAGTAGGNTTFGSWTTIGGASAITGGSGGANSTGTLIQRIKGNDGGQFLGGTTIVGAQTGGAGPWGGAGAGGYTSAGVSATTNSGAGGGGGSASGYGCYGAGAGEYVEFIISPPAATYSYAVGAGGTGGSTTYSGGNGGSGIIIVEEYYNYA